jgi:ABC-type lipopolysaccharide export system ATPase subunit
VIDKNIEHVTRITDRHYIIERDRAVWSGTSEALIAEPDLQHRYFGVSPLFAFRGRSYGTIGRKTVFMWRN